MPIASPAVMEKMGNRFRKAVDAFAEDHDIPIVHFKKGDRHIDVMTPYLEAATEPTVVGIGVAQEFQSVFAASQRRDFGQLERHCSTSTRPTDGSPPTTST